MKFKEIKTKRRCSQMYSQGFFGNSLKTWNTAKEYLNDPDAYHKAVIRQASSGGGGICIYDVPWHQVASKMRSLKADGHKNLYVSEQLPGQPDCMVFQGEYVLGGDVPYGEYLRYSTFKGFHRESMAVGKECHGARCRLMMKSGMPAESYETLMEFAEAHPGHIIEFSISDKAFGSLRKHMIIWEIRKF